MDWLSGAIAGAVVVIVGLLFVRARRAADVGPASTSDELAADVKRDIEFERLNTRPKV